MKKKLLLSFLILPLFALAHGEEILYIAFSQFISFVILFTALAVIKMDPDYKLVLFTIYLAATIITYFIAGKFDYYKYSLPICLLTGAAPLLLTFYVYRKIRFK